jgi:cytochrome c oxidase assembly protein subunit 15
MSVSKSLAPATYRRITTLALGSLALIILSGGAVRLTGTGLGCSERPKRHPDGVVAELEYHQMIEFLNRLFTAAGSVLVILAVLGSLARRPRRRDLTRWSFCLVAGVLGQIVLGGMVVLFDLSPWLVIGHFVLSMVLVWNAVVLRHRAGHDGGTARPAVDGGVIWLGRVLVGAAAAAVLSGTIVTGAGPHGGDPDVERLPFLIHTVARVHGVIVMTFLALTLAAGWRLFKTGAAPAVRNRYGLLLVALVGQAAIGYTQYFTGVPVLLVGLHIAGATLLWIAVLSFHLGLFAARAEVIAPAAVSRPHVGAAALS